MLTCGNTCSAISAFACIYLNSPAPFQCSLCTGLDTAIAFSATRTAGAFAVLPAAFVIIDLDCHNKIDYTSYLNFIINYIRQNPIFHRMKKYPEGHFLGMWMGIGIAIFSGVGIPLSVATDNSGFIGIGPALGVALGLAIGQSMENKYKAEGKIRPLTKEEKRTKQITLGAGVVILIIGLLVALSLWFLRN